MTDATPTGLEVITLERPGREPIVQEAVPILIKIDDGVRSQIIHAARNGPGSALFVGFLLVSPDSLPRKGTMKVPDGGSHLSMTYDDDDCPDKGSLQLLFTNLHFPRRNLYARSYDLRDFGDGDGFGDPGEILDLSIDLVNAMGRDLTGVSVQVSSDDPGVQIVRAEAPYGDLVAGSNRSAPAGETAKPIRLVVQESAATGPARWSFHVHSTATEFQGSSHPVTLSLPLARDAASIPDPAPPYREDFDSASPPIHPGLEEAPILTFYQIASLGREDASGVVQISQDGGATWTSLVEMPVNGPNDAAPEEFFFVFRACYFDATDNGSTEDDRFDPPDPDLPSLVPSSKCTALAGAPNLVYEAHGQPLTTAGYLKTARRR